MQKEDAWPELITEGWVESLEALQLWSQVVGKTRLALAPMMNHWWQVPLYVTARGLGTSMIPYQERGFEVELNLRDSLLEIVTTDGREERFVLDSPNVADFYQRFFAALRTVGIEVRIRPLAVEISETVHLDQDTTLRRYRPDWGRRFHGALTQANRLFTEFRSAFSGKASPVHFFWGSADLAVTRFSGRRAPLHPGGAPHCPDWVMQEAYAEEVSSAGFWPGNRTFPLPVFYSYAYPAPRGFESVTVLPVEARWNDTLKEFVLPYDAVRRASSPDHVLMEFLESTYEAAAELGKWPRETLERADFAEMAWWGRQEELPLYSPP